MILNTRVKQGDISNHYNELDDFYRELWGTHLHHGLWTSKNESKEVACENLSLKVLSYFNSLKDKRLGDIGCGYGETARLAINKGAKEIVGFTISSKQLEYAKKNSLGYSIEYLFENWLENSLENNCLDGAYSIECFSHIEDKKQYFEQIKRVLKPNSIFVLADWMSSESPSSLEQSLILQPICREGHLPSLYKKSEIEKCISGAKLELKAFIDLSDNVWKTWLLSSGYIINLLRKRKGLSYLFNSKNKEKRFIFAIFRILLGYRLGCFRYGLFVGTSRP